MSGELLDAKAYAEGVAQNRAARQQQPYLYSGLGKVYVLGISALYKINF